MAEVHTIKQLCGNAGRVFTTRGPVYELGLEQDGKTLWVDVILNLESLGVQLQPSQITDLIAFLCTTFPDSVPANLKPSSSSDRSK